MRTEVKRRGRFRSFSPLAVRRKAGNLLWGLFRLGLIAGISYVILYPLIMKLSISFMSRSDMYDMSVKWIPRTPTLENFKEALQLLGYGEYFWNTLLLSVGATLLQVTSCTLTAYGLARFKFRGRNFLFFCVIFMLIVPPQTYTIASYNQFRYFNGFGLLKLFGSDASVSLLNTPLPVFILSAGCAALKNGLFIYVLRQFFQKLPTELEEAAWVDGAGVFRIFRSIMLPNALPALTTVTVFSFVWTWNDLYSAQTYMPNMKLFATALSTLTFQITRAAGNASSVDVVGISMVTNAGALLIILPLLLFFFVTQRFFVEGVERTGLTGL